MEDQDKQYIKGFNAGYLLSQHEPELLKQLLKTKEANEYFKGLKSGKKQHDRELLLAQLKTSTNSKDKGMGR
ncbi:MAG: hypothetical protein JST86_01005 [Bacteroidetes bacterium]|nr:hypothetical protein [Bacteroidota bacterium]